MKFTLHIVRKDLRATRLAWSLWIALVAVQLLVAFMAFSTRNSSPDSFRRLTMSIDGFALLWAIFGYLLTAAVVLQDSPVGTKAFWLTRPVSGFQMLAAKALWVLLFVVIAPALIAVPWGIYCHFGVTGITEAFLRTSLLILSLVAPSFVIAVIAGNGSRFLVYNLVFMAVLMTCVIYMTAYRLKGDPAELAFPAERAWALIFLFGAGAVVHQFVRRQWATSLCIAASGLLLTICLLFVPMQETTRKRDRPADAAFAAQIGAEAGNTYSYAIHDGAAIGINLHLGITGVPNDYALAPGMADIEMKWPDGSSYRDSDVPLRIQWDTSRKSAVRTVLGMPDVPQFGGDPETLEKVKADAEIMRRQFHERNPDKPVWPLPDFMHSPKRESLEYTLDLIVTPEIAKKIAASPPSCSVTADIFLVHPKIVATIPLNEVGRAVADGARIHILSAGVTFDPGSKQSFLEDSVTYSASPAAALAFFEFDRNYETEDELKNSNIFTGLSLEGLPFVPLGHLSLRLPVGRLWRNDRWVDDPTWSSSVQMAAVHFEGVGGATRVVHMDRFKLNSANRVP